MIQILHISDREGTMSDNEPKKKSHILRWILIIVVLLVIVIVALPFIIDANQFKPQIQSQFSDVLGREVKIGNLNLSILSGSVVVNDISISDNPAFSHSPFLQAKSLKVGVELKPLIFSKAVRVTGISVDEPVISLIRSASGEWNFSDLGSSRTTKKETSPKASGGISESDISVKELTITNGRITITQSGKPSVYDKVNIKSSNLSYATAFPFSLSAGLPGGGSLQLTGKAGPLNKTDMIETPLSADISVKGFNLVASGAVAPGSGLEGLIDFNGSLTSDGRIVQSKGNANADKLLLVKGGTPSTRPIALGYAVNYDLAHQSGSIKDAKLKYGKAVAQLNGTFDRKGDGLLLKMKLRAASMPVQDIKAILPAIGVQLPKGATLEGGSLTVDAASEGMLEKMVTTGTIELANSRLTGYDLGGKLSAIATLAGIKSSPETDIEKFASGVRFSPEGIQVSNLILNAPTLGELTGDGSVAPNQSLDFKMLANLKLSGGIGGSLLRLTNASSMKLPFFVRGTTSDPKFVPDAKKAAGSLLESLTSGDGKKESSGDAKKALGDTLRNLFKK
jgi:AsmA protein